jgi:hypothetical protein
LQTLTEGLADEARAPFVPLKKEAGGTPARAPRSRRPT